MARAKIGGSELQKLHPSPLRIIFGEQRFENKSIRHTCLSHLAWMSTFQTDTPKPTKTNISADGRENLGNRQISIRQNPRAVSWFFRLRVHAERGKRMTLDTDFLRLVTLREKTINGGQQSWMACTTTRYRNQFSVRGWITSTSQAWHVIMPLCETSLGGPWRIDLFKTNLIKEEFARRRKLELFEVAEGFILKSL